MTSIDQHICPICRKTDVRHVNEFSRDDLSGAPKYKIIGCQSCGHNWASGSIEQKLYDEIYSLYFYGTSQQSVPHEKDGSLSEDAKNYPPVINSQKRVEWLKGLGLKGSLLDIGAGRGYFVRAANAHFEAEGFEIQHEAVKMARKMGVTMHEGDILASQKDDLKTYDVVTLWDVYSGFPDPRAPLDRLMETLNPGGALVITFPDIGSRVAKLTGKRWPLMIPPGNLHFYTQQSVEKLFDHPDVDRIEQSHQAKMVAVSFLLHKFLRTIGLYRLAKKKWPIPPAWKLPVNLGDILVVTVYKKDGL